MTPPDLSASRVGSVGLLQLDRPASLNALTMDMLGEMAETLARWSRDPSLTAVVIASAGDRGFCAGGDIKAVHRGALAGGSEVEALWRLEYAVDHAIARFPAPVVTVMHGITMGGGMGLACHASHRLVTADARLAMPEVRIGMAPDVGGCLLLGRAPGRLGEHLALTGGEVLGSDAVHLGMADHLVAPVVGAELAEEIDVDGIEAPLAARSLPLLPASLERERGWVDECYSAESVPEILGRLGAHPASRARDALDALGALPPRALAVTLKALRRARALDDLGAVLRQDLRVMTRFLDTTDLLEGIRSRLIDRSRPPAWDPGSFAELSEDAVARHFQPMAQELDLERR